MKSLRLCFSGFGAVGQRLAQLLLEKEVELAEQYGLRVMITGISTPSRGTLVDPNGLDIANILAQQEKHRHFDMADKGYLACDVFGMLDAVEADVFCEMSTLSIEDGEPAASYIEKAFSKGMHVITTNKGPEANCYRKLKRIAEEKGLAYLFETAVMDGAPVFNFAQECLRGCHILKIQGVLNGTTNYLLEQYEKGVCYDDAIREAQRMHWAEADPSMDVDGWDGAAKICALANILMDADTRPSDVERISIRGVGPSEVCTAANQGKKYKYICQAEKTPDGIHLSVSPQLLPADSLPCSVNGNSAAVTFYTDLAGEVTSVLTNGTILQTAYGVYSDMLRLIAQREGLSKGACCVEKIL